MNTFELRLHEREQQLRESQSEWSQATFGTDEERGPVGGLKHLAKEAIEAVDAFGDRDRFIEELADIRMLFWDVRRRGRVSDKELLDAVTAKLVVVRARTYPKPTSDEPAEHVRGEA